MKFYLYAIICLKAILIGQVETLECYSCNNISNISTCNGTTHCSSGQSCFLDLSNNAYRLGCIGNQQCGSFSNVASSLVGRALKKGTDGEVSLFDGPHPLTQRDLSKRNEEHCFECCSTDVCNIHLCQHLKPTTCIDDAKVDCAWMNSRFNICQIVHEAKVVCPKFCGLCSLIDGNWAGWSSWSKCDVTCANGTQTRTRQCSNPTPVSGGLTCLGSGSESRSCSFPPCPVTPTVAFRSHNAIATSLSTNQIIVFQTVTFNAGNGYDSSTGKFTAPLPGLYSFTTQLCVYSSNSIYFAIVHNGEDIIKGLHVGGNSYVCPSTSSNIVLQFNDTVWIRCAIGTCSLAQNDNFWNTFSGELIHI